MHAHRHRLDQRRPAAGHGPLTRRQRRLEHRLRVVAVDGHPGASVGLGALDGVDGELLVDRRRVGVLVVLQDEHDRQLLNPGPVHRLVEVAAGGRAVAEPGQRAAPLAAQLERHRHAGRHQHHVGEHRDHPDAAPRAVAEVHVAVAPAGDAGRPAHVLGEDLDRRHAADQVRGQVTVQDAQPILGGHRERRAGRDGLLAVPVVERAGNLALAVEAHRPLLDAAHHQHRAQQLGPVRELEVVGGLAADRYHRVVGAKRRVGRHLSCLPCRWAGAGSPSSRLKGPLRDRRRGPRWGVAEITPRLGRSRGPIPLAENGWRLARPCSLALPRRLAVADVRGAVAGRRADRPGAAGVGPRRRTSPAGSWSAWR